MKSWTKIVSLMLVSILLVAVLVAAPGGQRWRSGRVPTSEEAALKGKIARFAPTTLTANTASLAPNDRKALEKIIAAAKYLDPLYLRQVWSGNEALLKKLEAESNSRWPRALALFFDQQGALVPTR